MTTHARLLELLDYCPLSGFFRWRVPRCNVQIWQIAGYVNNKGYREICIDGKLHKAHRLAWLYIHTHWPKQQIDHINRCRDDNRLENLREATAQQNAANRLASSVNRLGIKGVTYDRGSFVAYSKYLGKHKYLGSFKTADEAHRAQQIYAQKTYGEFACSDNTLRQ